jgi:hypothetical protein
MHRPTTHILYTTLSPNILSVIKEACNLPPTLPILRSTYKRNTYITVKHLRDFISYGVETSDAIITLYMDMLCNDGQATYLHPSFLPRLRQHGWRVVSRSFASSSQGYYARKLDRPNKTGEQVIMIPLFVDNNHWIALVHREINSKVFFFYSDDMNQRNNEDNIKNLIFNHTDMTFCPPDSQWIHCQSTYVIPHSNECGPRTLLALHIMAFHPSPHQNMLLPLMDSNLSQISRAWIAASFLIGRPLHESPASTFQHRFYTDTRSSSTMQSNPFNIIPWDDQYIDNNTFSIESGEGIYDQLSPLDENFYRTTYNPIPPVTKDTYSHPSKLNKTLTSPKVTNKVNKGMQPPPGNILPNQISCPTTCTYSNQKKITEWTTHRPFPLSPDGVQGATLNTNHIQEGTMPPRIDPTRTIRITMQNTQYSLQLTNDNYNPIQLTQNLKEIDTAIFAAISPNINWHNPSHRVQSKYPFTRIFKQIHMSTMSSDIGKLPQYISTPNLVGGAAILTLDHWAS